MLVDKETGTFRVIETVVSKSCNLCQSTRLDEQYGESKRKTETPTYIAHKRAANRDALSTNELDGDETTTRKPVNRSFQVDVSVTRSANAIPSNAEHDLFSPITYSDDRGSNRRRGDSGITVHFQTEQV